MEPKYVLHVVRWVAENFYDQQLATLQWVAITEPTVKNDTMSADTTPTLTEMLEFGLIRKRENKLVATSLGWVVVTWMERVMKFHLPPDTCESVEEMLSAKKLLPRGVLKIKRSILCFANALQRAEEDGLFLSAVEQEGGTYTLNLRWVGNGDMPDHIATKWRQELEILAVTLEEPYEKVGPEVCDVAILDQDGEASMRGMKNLQRRRG